MKKGRHRRFEEARKLKQSGPAAFGFGPRDRGPSRSTEEDDEYAALAEKYGVTFDDDDDDDDVATAPGAQPARLPSRRRELVNVPAPQRRARRARRPRQDHPGRRPAARHRRLRRPPGAGRPGHGLQRPGARAGHHHPRQGRLGHVAGRQDQPGRHARATPTSAARSSGRWPWSTACCCSSTRPRGRCPQTRYVLSEGAGRATCRRSSCSTRSTAHDARPDEVLDEIYQLFIDLDADDRPHRVPGHLGRRPRGPRRSPASACPATTPTSPPLLDAILDTIPAPGGDPDAPLQALVTNLDASDYLGRLAIGRVVQGHAAPGRAGRPARRGVRRGPAAAQAPPQPADGASRGIGRAEVDELRGRRPVRRRRLPRGRDRRHHRRPGRPRGRCPASSSTSRCCA